MRAMTGKKVPKVRLVDPNVEPTDEEPAMIAESMMEGVKQRAEKAEAAFQARMRTVFGSQYRASSHEQ